jgi:hypothetical protein
MANTVYANTDAHLVPTQGGCLSCSVAAGTNTQATATVTPCKVVYISQGLATASLVRFGVFTNTSIAISTTVSLGAHVPTIEGGITPSTPMPGPVEVLIDDVSKVWFSSAATACLGLTYRG